jgi:DNA-binding beta-propeller fold protein YncE
MKKFMVWLGLGLMALGFAACSKNNPVAPQVNPGKQAVHAQSGAVVKSLEFYGNLSTGYAFAHPVAAAVSQSTGDVFIADLDNNRVQKKYYSGGSGLVTANPFLTDDASIINRSMRQVYCVSVDSFDGKVYVADSGNDRVLVLNPDNLHVSKQLKSPNYMYGENPDAFKNPKGILSVSFSSAFGPQQSLYICDGIHQNIRVFRTMLIKSSTQAWSEYFYANHISAYQNLQFIVRDNSSKLWVSDFSAGRVIQFDPAHMETALQVVNAQFPAGLAVDKNNLLFVTEYNNRKIRIFNPDGTEQAFTYSSAVPFNHFTGPVGLAIDNKHNVLYVCDTAGSQVLQFVIHYQ